MNNCDLNTCSDRIPAQCVLFTCDVTSPYITLEGCNPSLCDYLAITEVLVTTLKDNDGIDYGRIRNANSGCQFTKINTLLDTRNLIDLKVKTSDTILTLLDIICDQQTEIDELKDGGIYDLDLPQEILDNVAFKRCYEALLDPCDKVKIKTLKHLLIALIEKSCP